jgi:hypothetical protein
MMRQCDAEMLWKNGQTVPNIAQLKKNKIFQKKLKKLKINFKKLKCSKTFQNIKA